MTVTMNLILVSRTNVKEYRVTKLKEHSTVGWKIDYYSNNFRINVIAGKPIVEKGCLDLQTNITCASQSMFYRGVGRVISHYCTCNNKDYCNTARINCANILLFLLLLFGNCAFSLE